MEMGKGKVCNSSLLVSSHKCKASCQKMVVLLRAVQVCSLFLLCSCSTLQDMQQTAAIKQTLNESYQITEINPESRWFKVDAKETLQPSGTHLLDVVGKDSKPVQEAISSYGQPNFIRVKQVTTSNPNDILGTDKPAFKITLIYETKNLYIGLNQQTGEVQTSELEKVLTEYAQHIASAKKERQIPERNEGNIGESGYQMLVDRALKGRIDPKFDSGIPADLFEKHQRQVAESASLAVAKQAEDAKNAATEAERKRREFLPADKEIAKFVVGRWKYEQRSDKLAEKSIIDYKADGTFSVNGKLLFSGQGSPIAYSGNWSIKEGRIMRTVKTVSAAGQVISVTPFGRMAVPMVKEGAEDQDVLQSVTASKLETVESDRITQSKVLTRMEAESGDTAVPAKERIAGLKKKAESYRDKTLVLKGLYLGMPIKDAAALLALYMDLPEAAYPSEMISEDGKSILNEDVGVCVKADETGGVTEFKLLKKCVDRLFDSKGVPVKNFVRTF